ncbi:hypothetical protein SAMN02949497_3555 [Methylomagnum ishizawai]|uniref:Uncharacterized protein n=1 Tax=Methylomagnum ishizawai TaxID=1760988 RepID=A0A1Y6D171_9GAMM|nr:hypothetical protein [Methylomagnum ishizawai]SMF96170.1 hypothetical protein SAMN02949497_3555 [Methylomagnum ishizawai]
MDYPDLFSPTPTPIHTPAPPGRGYTGGYAARPGTGPQGATCRQCQHYALVEGHIRWYRKCGLMKERWTHGKGSDIKARSPACAKFEAEIPELEVQP